MKATDLSHSELGYFCNSRRRPWIDSSCISINKKLFTGISHFHAARKAVQDGEGADVVHVLKGGTNGFVTNSGNFITDKGEAWRIAESNGQIRMTIIAKFQGLIAKQLLSEYLIVDLNG